MSRKPSTLLPAAATRVPTPAALPEGLVAGMVNPATGTVEVAQFGLPTADGLRVGFHWQTGRDRFEGGVVDLAGLELYALTRSLAAAGAAYRRGVARAGRRCPVPPTPRGVDHSRWLAMCNCD